jgi:hypothetical protein
MRGLGVCEGLSRQILNCKEEQERPQDLCKVNQRRRVAKELSHQHALVVPNVSMFAL